MNKSQLDLNLERHNKRTKRLDKIAKKLGRSSLYTKDQIEAYEDNFTSEILYYNTKLNEGIYYEDKEVIIL